MTTRTIGYGAAAVWLTLATIAAAIVVPGGEVRADPPETMPGDRIQAAAAAVETARELQGAGRFEEAAEAWGEVAEAFPENGTAWFNLGYCLHASGHLEEALEVHRKAATFDEYRGIALYNLGCAYALLGRPEAALEALAGAQASGFAVRSSAEGDSDLDSLRDDPRFAELLAREPAGAAGALQQALAGARQFLEAKAPQIEQQVAIIARQLMEQAHVMLGELQRKIAEDPQLSRIAQMIQEWLWGGRSDRQARPEIVEADPFDELQAAEPLAPRTLEAWFAAAQEHQQAGEWGEAVDAYEAVIEEDGENIGAWFGLAYCLHMKGDYEHAIEAHRKAATFEPTRGIALYNLGCAYALTGQPEKAVAALRKSWKAGFDVLGSAAGDSDLESLHGDPRFKKLMAEMDDGVF